jgi:MFS family permease
MTTSGTVAVLIALAGGVVLAACAQTAIVGALPEIAGAVGTLGEISWPVTAYLVLQAVSTLVFGALAGIDNPRPLYLVAMGMFLVGAVFAGLAPTLGQLMISRAVQGFGAGGLLALGFEVVGELVRPRWRVRYRSMLVLLWAAGMLVGPFVGGLITERAGWPSVFYVNVPIGLLILLLGTVGLRLPRHGREGEFDVVGSILLALELVLVALYLSWQGPLRGWISGGGLVILAECVAALVLLLVWEGRAKQPLLPLRLLRCSGFRRVALIAVLPGSGLFGVLVFFPAQAQIAFRAIPSESGFLVLPLCTAVLVGAVPFFHVGGHRFLLALGAGTVLAATALLYWQPISFQRSHALVLTVIAGVGIGLVWRFAVHIGRSVVPPDAAGKTIPAILFLQTVGCVIAAAMAGAVLSLRLARYGPLLRTAGLGPEAIRLLPDSGWEPILQAFQQAGQQILGIAVAVTTVAFVLGWTVRTVPLRGGAALAEAEPEPLVTEPAVTEAAVTTDSIAIELTLTEPDPPVTEPPPEDAVPTEPELAPVRAEDWQTPESPPSGEPIVPRRSPGRRVKKVSGALVTVFTASYCAGLVYAGPGILRGTTVNGVEIGGLQPVQAERTLHRALGPTSTARTPVQAGDRRLSLDPRTAGLGIDLPATVAELPRRSANPIQLADTLLHAPRRWQVRTVINPVRLRSALAQIDHEIHQDPQDGSITFGADSAQAVPARDGRSLDFAAATEAVEKEYMRQPVRLPLRTLHPRVGNRQVQQALRDFAAPAVSGPVLVSADGKTAVLFPAQFATHLSMTADEHGQLHPKLDGAGVLGAADAQLGSLQTQPQAGGSHLQDGHWVQTQPRDGHIIRPEDLASSLLRVLPRHNDRVAYVPLVTVHP